MQFRPNKPLRNLGVYNLRNKTLILLKRSEELSFLFTPETWQFHGPVDYRVSHGDVYCRGELTGWTDNDLVDTGLTATTPPLISSWIPRTDIGSRALKTEKVLAGPQHMSLWKDNPAADPTLQEQLKHVYWIGGGSSAGKSTIARRVAARYGLRVYATDDVMADHARRSSPDECPLLHEFMRMNMDQRWLERSPQTMLETFHWFKGECFNLIVEDLLRLPREERVVVEGFRLLPHLVKPLRFAPDRAVWLLPTQEFRQTVIESRGGSSWRFLAQTTDPEKALRNLLERDRLFTDMLREETARLGLPSIEIDTTTTEDDVFRRVTDVFQL